MDIKLKNTVINSNAGMHRSCQ